MIRLWRSPFNVFHLQTTDIVEDKKYAFAVTEIFGRKGIDSEDSSRNGLEITVIYTDVSEKERRIISAWRAERHERKAYWESIA